jgi:hypothetical protein
VLSLDSLAFNLLRDNDEGEQYQLNWLSVESVAVAEAGTLALSMSGLLGIMFSQRMRFIPIKT